MDEAAEVQIYKAKIVSDLEAFYGELLINSTEYPSIFEHLNVLAKRMWVGVQQGNTAVLSEISNYHQQHLGKPPAILLNSKLKEDDCRQAIANEFGFRRWTEVAHMRYPYEVNFELALNVMLQGRIKTLERLLVKHPGLVNYKSPYGHKATLLHYAASNGVELWRQQVPMNLPEIVAILIQNGANTRAKMKVYGGEYTAAELLPSSAHPIAAGISDTLRKQFDAHNN